ncbi:MAG: flagella synthesis protein FlgN [Oceanococcus sp.]
MNEKLINMLHEQLHTATELLSVLEQESTAVIRGDLERLQNVGHAKEHCCQALSDLESTWPAAMRGVNANEWVAQQGEEISSAWDQLIDGLRLCRRQNDANGLLIAERQQWVSRKLSSDNGQTYGAEGEASNAAVSTWNASA